MWRAVAGASLGSGPDWEASMDHLHDLLRATFAVAGEEVPGFVLEATGA